MKFEVGQEVTWNGLSGTVTWARDSEVRALFKDGEGWCAIRFRKSDGSFTHRGKELEAREFCSDCGAEVIDAHGCQGRPE